MTISRDLSYNNLTGPVHDILAELPFLQVLNLSRNQLIGSIPSAFLVKSQNGLTAQHLARVHHQNLVSMIGCCNDKDCLLLVYEYMSQGTLQDHLQGRTHNAGALSWGQRLQIAVDAAQGPEYICIRGANHH
ncbi:putative receptor-like protein kinase At3g46340 [Musa acuminata AAA Group]|uniref:putative receptor-like protein kinase At3g46340 n=1 Tax=Musa acuminata AAA Group TaxID=214697 RepID=UPI0031DC994A